MAKKVLIIILVILIFVILGIYFVVTNQKNGSIGDGDNNALNSFEVEGMKVDILRQGSGAEAKVGDFVTTHYVGTLQDGTEFDSSVKRNIPYSFQLGQNRVIRGWDLGVLGMKVGEERKLTIPFELAYGPDGFPPSIPERATLTFVINLLSISPPPPAQ
mgnify:CR=1 FL=1